VLTPNEARFAVRLTPRSGSSRVDGVVDGVLRVRVSAPPVDGAANRALVEVLAEALDISRSRVRLVAGAAGPRKLVVVDGVDPQQLRARWPGLRV
jgi:uncharacterized protein YggU (UPF0235/DUF167 family)